MLLPQILSFFKFYPYCGSSKTEVLCTYFRQRKVPYQKKNRPFSSDVFCQKVRTVSTVATGFIRYWICILKFFLHNVKNLKLLLAFSYTFMHKEITFYIYRSICRLDQYTCRIAVGIPKTAIGVTAILLTAISETAMAAKN